MIFKRPVVHLKQWKKFSVDAGFTTRHFPLFLKKADDLSEISNQEKLKEARIGTHFVFLNQVHGENIAVLEDAAEATPGDAPAFRHFPETDSVITNLCRTTLLVLTADCLSIFFCAMKNKKVSWVGLTHAGWRGTRKKIAQKTFILLMQKARCPAKDIHIAFGPAIGAKHYEVGEEFQGYFPESVHRIKGKLFFDLAGENKKQLMEAGADPKNISDSKMDTFSGQGRFYSFRREKEAAGRIISFIRKY